MSEEPGQASRRGRRTPVTLPRGAELIVADVTGNRVVVGESSNQRRQPAPLDHIIGVTESDPIGLSGRRTDVASMSRAAPVACVDQPDPRVAQGRHHPFEIRTSLSTRAVQRADDLEAELTVLRDDSTELLLEILID